MAPICRNCPRPLERRRGETTAEFRRRKYCSQPCALEGRNRSALAKLHLGRLCAADGCPNPIVPRKGEYAIWFNQRRFCSPPCRNRASKEPRKPPLICPNCGAERRRRSGPSKRACEICWNRLYELNGTKLTILELCELAQCSRSAALFRMKKLGLTPAQVVDFAKHSKRHPYRKKSSPNAQVRPTMPE